MHIENDDLDALRSSLLSRLKPDRIANETTRLVVEGYPRSSNSYTAFMIYEAAKGRFTPRDVSHHTHDAANLRIAGALGIPRVILLRDPEDAILSFHVFSGRPIPMLTARYIDFYQQAAPLFATSVVAHFDDTTKDFGKIIKQINAVWDLGLNEELDIQKAQERVLERVRSNRYGDTEEVKDHRLTPEASLGGM